MRSSKVLCHCFDFSLLPFLGSSESSIRSLDPAMSVRASPFPNVKLEIASLTEYVFREFEKREESAALIDGISGQTLTYRELRENVKLVGAGLHHRNFKQNEVLLIFSPNN